MAAIAGLVHLDGRPEEEGRVAAMLRAMRHRGTALQGTAPVEGGRLGAAFDPTTPESLHASPVAHSPSGRYTVAADVRLDDRPRLAYTLGLSDDTPDTALVAHALDRWDRDAPAHLTGDFAFAAWDHMRRELFCARDPMGVRPFYYTHLPGRFFAFASEQRALVGLPGFDRTLDRQHLADYLLVTLNHTSTFYRHLRRLPAATTLSVDQQDLHVHPSYWSLDPEHELHLRSDAAYAEAFYDVFERAVRDRLRSVHPVGAALSGGLDSSAIAVVAQQHVPSPLPAFFAEFPGVPEAMKPYTDERPYVEAVIARGGFDLHAVTADREGPFSDYARVSDHLEDAFRTINLYVHWQLFERAQQAGVRVFLDGLDGDTTVSHGIDRLADLSRERAWDVLAHEVRHLGTSPAHQRRLVDAYAMPVLARALRQGRPDRTVGGLWHLRRALGISGQRLGQGLRAAFASGAATERAAVLDAAFMRPAFAGETDAWARHAAYREAAYGPAPSERAAHIRDVRGPLCPTMLEMEDRTAAAFGIEPRYPFFDRRLIEFCVALPSDQKLRDGLTRHVLREGLRGRLPEKVRTRTTKGNLKPAFDLALARTAQHEIAPYLFETTPFVAEMVDLPALRRAYDRFIADPLAYSSVGTQIYAIATLERGLHRLGLT